MHSVLYAFPSILVGPSGGGKSTIARLIARFWDVTGGNITIGGKNIKGDIMDIPLDIQPDGSFTKEITLPGTTPCIRPQIRKQIGRKFYTVTFTYDSTAVKFDFGFAARVRIWKDTGEPLDA